MGVSVSILLIFRRARQMSIEDDHIDDQRIENLETVQGQIL